MARLYKDQGCASIFINGTTGEFASLTLNERILLTESWVENSKDLGIWVHVGHPSQHEAIQLARHAKSIGATAVSALAPFYFVPSNEEQLINFLIPIAHAVHPLPFYYYHIPSMTHMTLDLETFVKGAVAEIPNFSGLKFSSPDLHALQTAHLAAKQASRSIDILFGIDEMLLGALPFGIAGAIGSTYNFAAPLYHRLLNHFQEGDIERAQTLQLISSQIVQEFHTYGGISTGKAIMEMLGIPCGPPRPPLTALSSHQCKSLHRKISALDAFPHALQSPKNL